MSNTATTRSHDNNNKNDDEDDDSDEWGKEEVIVPQESSSSSDDAPFAHFAVCEETSLQHSAADHPDDDWLVPTSTRTPPCHKAPKHKSNHPNDHNVDDDDDDDRPILLVNLTRLDATLDPHDTDAVSAWRKRITTNHAEYAKNATWLADRTVIPCGKSVWRDALMKVRREGPSNVWSPIFPLPLPPPKPK